MRTGVRVGLKSEDRQRLVAIVADRNSPQNFKMNKARKLLKERADERVRLLYSVIEEFLPSGFSVVVSPDAIRRVYGSADKFARHPFYCAFSVLAPLLAQNLGEFGYRCADFELCLDDQMREKYRMLKAWDWARERRH
jgi:hypothetical protein